jgi:hypothetical protein
VIDMSTELGRYVGTVYYRNGIATTTGGFTPR